VRKIERPISKSSVVAITKKRKKRFVDQDFGSLLMSSSKSTGNNSAARGYINSYDFPMVNSLTPQVTSHTSFLVNFLSEALEAI
jgi:hypothetical protein